MKTQTAPLYIFTKFNEGDAFKSYYDSGEKINDNFKKADLQVEEWVERFETESREVFAHRREIVEAAGIKEGDAVADVGAGTGLFTKLFAEKVGEKGKVLAVDIATPFLANIHKRAEAAGLKNVETILCTDRNARIPRESVDVVFICDTYHHFEYPQSTMASIHWGLKPGGTLVVIDFHRIEGKSSEWTLNHVRAGQDVFEKEIEAAGFEKMPGPQPEYLKENYLVKFRKKS
jgi:ubiquinone/menaquinone biosynthesis C-methylase UbiE